MLSSNQIRSSFIDFFKGKEHTFVPSSPLVPIGDETLLFANAGMNQFKDIFLGLVTPPYRRAVNSQKCLRVSGKHNDLEEVGRDSYHHTFFEMLGNWSFNDYFKAEAIQWAWELLTGVWGIKPELLWATVFEGDASDNLPRDDEAAQLWTKLTPISPDKVLFYGKKDNFWEMGNTGPCGPCSEIHIDLGPSMCDKQDVPGHKCAVNGGCSRFIELWNLVFIQYNRDEEGKLAPLPARYIDTGAGLERVAAVLQNKRSNYDTDLFSPITDAVAKITGHKYTSQLHNKTDIAFRVIADHIRALTFAITDGAMPSNEGRGYCIRRILRRAARFGRELGMHEPFIYKLVPVVVDILGGAFEEAKQRAEHTSVVIKSEEESFGKTLDRGIEIFNSAAQRAVKSGKKIIDGEDAFQLYDTYGFPLDLTELMASERGLKVDKVKFEKLMEQQRQRARAAQKTTAVKFSLTSKELPVTDDSLKYQADKCESEIIGWADFEGYHTEESFGIENIRKKDYIQIAQEDERKTAVILQKTCFYAEAGGQIGDCGVIESVNGRFIADRAEKIGDSVFHWGRFEKGYFHIGEKVTAIVSKDRNSTRKNHTATHLLQWALQQVVGKSVAQQGSFVSPDYLRFDFICPTALTAEQIKKVEDLVQEKIDADEPVTCTLMPRNQARKLGAMALFSEKYGEEVRVVCIGADSKDTLCDAFSREFCGGTHIDRTSAIGGFKIIKEESISAGVRRITALTGSGLNAYFEKVSAITDQLSEMLDVPADGLVERASQLLKENKRLLKEAKGASKLKESNVASEAGVLLEKAEKIGQTSIVVGRLSGASDEQVRSAIDMIKKKAQSAAIVFGYPDNDKVTLAAGVSEDLIKKGLSAGDLVKQLAPIIDGRGGGRPHMAQAGGKNPEKLDEALAKASEIIRGKLANA